MVGDPSLLETLERVSQTTEGPEVGALELSSTHARACFLTMKPRVDADTLWYLKTGENIELTTPQVSGCPFQYR